MAGIEHALRSTRERIRRSPVLRHVWRRFFPGAWRERLRPYLASKHWVQPPWVRELDAIGQDVRALIPQPGAARPVRILFGPSFSMLPACHIHDRTLSYALRLRGAEIHPFYCDAVQELECNCVGGVWKGQGLERACKACVRSSQRLWQDSPITPLPFSRYLNREDYEGVEEQVRELTGDCWVSFSLDGFPFGTWARDILVNNYVVGDYRLVPDHGTRGPAQVKNLLLLCRAYERVLADLKPDRVVANDSFYGMWAVMEKVCIRAGVPFYSHWAGTRPGGWCYACNGAAMNLDFSEPWQTFSEIPMSPRQRQKVEQWLAGRSSGKEMLLDTASAAPGEGGRPRFAGLRTDKPTALLAANVIWDLAALNRQVVFEDMIDWIAETVEWFRRHPEFQLVLKPHPGELHPSIPATEERVEVALARRNVELPDNVVLLSPRVGTTVYDLLPSAKLGLVHTTTVGVEMAARGMPVITTARSPYRGLGFTIDADSPAAYFELLGRTLRGETIVPRKLQMDLAYKFILFNFYHYYMKIDIMDWTWGGTPRLRIGSAAELLPGANQYIDYVAESILEGLPIISKERWPPES